MKTKSKREGDWVHALEQINEDLLEVFVWSVQRKISKPRQLTGFNKRRLPWPKRKQGN
jgi:hypothetical protein